MPRAEAEGALFIEESVSDAMSDTTLDCKLSKADVSAHIGTGGGDGHWLTMHHDDQPPYHFQALELWGYDRGSKQFTAYAFDNFSGIRHFTSPGWQDDRITWTDTAPARGVTDRFVFQRKDRRSYRVTYAVTRDGPPETLCSVAANEPSIQSRSHSVPIGNTLIRENRSMRQTLRRPLCGLAQSRG